MISHLVSHVSAAEPADHGGDIAAARRLFPGAPEPFIDLSTGINPSPYPLPDLSPDLFSRLPEQAAVERLATVAALTYGAPSAACVVPAPGTQILLPQIAAMVPPGRAAILGPTYAEHARAAALAGHEVKQVTDVGALGDGDLAVVVNPNNPDGRVVARDALLALIDGARRRGGLFVLDETFMDVGPPGASLAPDVGRGNVIVLRSFGKFFGLAGLRLGFAIAAPRIATRLRDRLGPWAVSGPAIAVGEAALADAAWAADARRRLAQGAAKLDEILIGAGLEIVGGTSLFRLLRTPAAPELFQHLGRAGIFVRQFAGQPHWLRFGLPGSEADWQRLNAAMAAFDGRVQRRAARS
jgi:cobalamin biosynthesis protein CobC